MSLRRTKNRGLILIIDNRREYTEKRFQYFGGEPNVFECKDTNSKDRFFLCFTGGLIIDNPIKRMQEVNDQRIADSHDITKSDFGMKGDSEIF